MLLDVDLALVYGVTTKRLNEQVRRNAERFPQDFLIQLTNQDVAALRSQFSTLNTGRGAHRKYPPVAFTEHGALMAATVLNSQRAVEMSIYVVRAFARLRQAVAAEAVGSTSSPFSPRFRQRSRADRAWHPHLVGSLVDWALRRAEVVSR
jgi:phage regulator Rha-like protein